MRWPEKNLDDSKVPPAAGKGTERASERASARARERIFEEAADAILFVILYTRKQWGENVYVRL